MIAIVAAFALSGCESLYLHNADVEKSTAAAKADLDQVKLAAVFDNQSAYLDKLETDELAAVRDLLAAQRDAEILLFLRGRGTDCAGSGCDGRSFLESRIDGRLRFIVGKSDRKKGGPKIWRMMQAATRDSAVDGSDLASAVSDAIKPLGQIVDAEQGTTLASPGGGKSLQAALGTLQTDADALQKQIDASTAAKAQVDAALKKAKGDLAPGQSAQDQLTDLANTAAKYLGDANPFIRKVVSAQLADVIQALIDATGPATSGAATAGKPAAGAAALTADARAGIGFLQAVAGIGDAFASPPVIPHPNALAAAQAWLQFVGSSADLDIAERRTTVDIDRARVAAVAAEAYFLSKAGEELARLPGSSLSGTQGLVDLLGKGESQDTAVIGGLIYYSDAWNRGFTRAMQIEREGPILERRAKVERSRRAGDAWIGTLKPALQTLADYGAGGLDPQAFASFLQALGLGAIAGKL